jgi:hypothetical protein
VARTDRAIIDAQGADHRQRNADIIAQQMQRSTPAALDQANRDALIEKPRYRQ